MTLFGTTVKYLTLQCAVVVIHVCSDVVFYHFLSLFLLQMQRAKMNAH